MNNIQGQVEYTKYDEIKFNFDDKEVHVRRGYIGKYGMIKIYPFEIEDLREVYNVEKFPDRERRKARVKRKYNFFGNIFVVIGYKYLLSTNFAKKSPIYISGELSKYIDISEQTFKTKMSQLKSYIKTNEKTCSIDLIKMYLNYMGVPYWELESIIKSEHMNLFKMKEEFEKLLKIYPSKYNYEFKFIDSFEV
jgi:hypothetical protein